MKRTIFHRALAITVTAALVLSVAPLDLLGQQRMASAAPAADAKAAAAPPAAAWVPDLDELRAAPSSELRDIIERYSDDRFALMRRYNVDFSPTRREKLRGFYTAWQSQVGALNFDALSTAGRIDHVLLGTQIRYELALLNREEKIFAETRPLLPFAPTMIDLQEARRRMQPNNPAASAQTLFKLAKDVEQTRKAVEAGVAPPRREGAPPAPPPAEGAEPPPTPIKTTKITALRAAQALTSLKRQFDNWYSYYSGYDPMFTWWVGAPYKKADDAIKAYTKVLRERVVGYKEGEDEPIVGDPIGRDELLVDLAHEMIPYSPEELVVIAEREFKWCEAEMLKASRAMGFGDDWRAALEKVKTLHVDPGKQPDLIREQAIEATEFVEKNDLVTVPQLAKDIWRIEMMTPERQKVAPFFLGGEVIQVSFPTNTMDHEDKLMSMRGNNIHFARATVHHELIPGHHLQGFMTDRYNSHRRAFATPFWGEGWALYWEMLLWDMNFPRTPENRVGMLFWRMHRAARIMFSLNFHLGKWTPQECIKLLVEKVGHERANAEAEVRRSFNGQYSPLYQIAYMIGGLQFRSLHRDLVGGKKMTNRQFHDAILKGGRMPVEMVRAMLLNQKLPRDYKTSWKWEGELRAATD